MNRILFYILLAAAILGSTYVVLFMPEFFKLGDAAGGKGIDILKATYELLKSGDFKFTFDAAHILIYTMVLFLLINAAVLITMVLTMLITFFRLSKIMKFYSICIWFFFSALIVTGGLIAFASGINVKLGFSTFSLLAYVPVLASIVTIILGVALKAVERKR